MHFAQVAQALGCRPGEVVFTSGDPGKGSLDGALLTPKAAGTFTVTARSREDTSKSDVLTVTVRQPERALRLPVQPGPQVPPRASAARSVSGLGLEAGGRALLCWGAQPAPTLSRNATRRRQTAEARSRPLRSASTIR